MTTVPDTQDERDTARGALREARVLLDPELRAWVGRLPPPVARVASYHFGWTDSAGRPDTAPAGKALRPTLVFAAAEAVGGRAQDALAPAVAVELTHNFSLLHDDILDGDTTRRHRATAWAVFGSSSALLAGDALLNQAVRVLTEADAPAHALTGVRWLTEATTQLIEGEQSDLHFEERSQVSLGECLLMTERKTAALLACACALGGLWGGGEERAVDALRRFGHHLGMAFQLTDDLLGIWGDPEVTGKPAGADLASRKKSLPVVAALDSGTPAARRLAELYTDEEPVDGEEPGDGAEGGPTVEALAALVEEAGGRAWAERAAAEQLALAEEALAPLPTTGEPVERLLSLAEMACRRSS
ncbi:geranylgeranyl diphosphate synthase, type I [Streptomyces zhaozhouensis]|uniref:Geranylgeranyl diphosphate synthase, type I n=1 Tax=Streptomyces zhaozhouensis TaxID=1300267 RepID=A0A286DS00_9ACTN|nr:polyprenyl synthetase family protein [Streptomyces zhaozhouensis]SOD61393.1 geranylgeranyl diphosphate synthase, type I [Streptomyces zhaozhouensis]